MYLSSMKLSVVTWCLFAALFVLIANGCSQALVKVESATPGAAVFVNDSAVGLTHWSGLLNSGPAEIEVERDGVTSLDTTLRIWHGLGRVLWWGVALGGTTVMEYCYLSGSGTVALLLAGANIGFLTFGSGLMVDHSFHAPLISLLDARKSLPPLHAIPYLYLQVKNKDTLVGTDSICWEPKRQTLWTWDHFRDQRHPYAINAINGCVLGSPQVWERDPLLPAIGVGIAVTTSVFGTWELGHPEDEYEVKTNTARVKEVALYGVTVGAFMGWFSWAMSPKHQRCEYLQDSIAFRERIAKYPCQSASVDSVVPVQTAPDTANGIRVIHWNDSLQGPFQ